MLRVRSRPIRGTGATSGAAVVIVPALLALGAAIRALRFVAPFRTPAHHDEAGTATWGIHVLDGALPAGFLGNEYQGVPGAYPLAAWFALVGPSTWALDVFAYGLGLLGLWTGWLVARRFLPRPEAVATLLVLAVPPLPLASRSLSGNLDYPAVLALGNVFLLGARAVALGAAPRRRALLGLGVVAGLGWWVSPLFLVYVAPVAWLALRTGLAWRSAAAWFAGGATLGSLPWWVYEIVYFPSTRHLVHAGGAIPVEPFLARAATILGEHVPALLGIFARGGRLAGAIALAVSVALILGGAALALWRDRAELRWAIGLGGAPGGGGLILAGVVVANLGVVLWTPQGAMSDRYLHPLYSVLPCWIGIALTWLWRRHRPVGVAAAGLLLAWHAWTSWIYGPGRSGPGQWRWAPIVRQLDPLVTWLEGRGIDRAYWAFRRLPPSYEMTFLAGGRVVFADPWREIALPHARLVDASSAPPFVAVRDSAEVEELRAGLPALGVEVRETTVGRYVVFETTPVRRSFVPLPRAGWTVSAEPNGWAAFRLTDGDAATAWTAGRRQEPGQWITVDLGRETVVARVDLLALDWRNVPAGFRVELSRDGRTWTPVAVVPRYWGPLFLSDGHPVLKVRRGRVQAVFAPTATRWIRIVQTSHAPLPWMARELFVYAPGPTQESGEGADPPLGPLLEGHRLEFVYAGPRLAARLLTESPGRLRVSEWNYFVNSNGRPRPDPRWLEPFRPEPGRALLLRRDADLDATIALLASRGLAVRRDDAGPYHLLTFPNPPAVRSLPRAGWRATATSHPADAARVLDGDPRTRWTSGGPVTGAEALAVDLGETVHLAGVRLALVPGTGPRRFTLEGSAAGHAWVPLEPTAWAGPLYWTGFELLANSDREWAVTVSPTSVRHLRVRPAEPSTTPWTVEELDVLP